MNANVRDCVVSGYEHLIPDLTLPDPGDRHVLAAAITGSANVIVTFNLRHFPKDILASYGIEAQHPDEFIRHLLDLYEESVVLAVTRQRQSLKNPPKTAAELLDTLEQQGLVQTVANLRQFSQTL